MTMQTEGNESDSRRRPRSVMATDSEWLRIREWAEAAGLSLSSFICLRTAGPERKPPPGPTGQAFAAKLERIETAILTLAELERQKLAERGEEDGWEAALRMVGFRLRTERPLTGDPAERKEP